MDASEEAASPRRECLTFLSYVATSCWPVADCVSHHFYPPTLSRAVNQKQMCGPQRSRNCVSLSALCLTYLGLIEQFLLFASNNSTGTGCEAPAQQTPGPQTRNVHASLLGPRRGGGVVLRGGTKPFDCRVVDREPNAVNTFALHLNSKTTI